MKRKQSIIGILLSILMIINIFPIIKASAASFTPRYSLSYEDTQSKYWASGTYGVSNGFPRNWNSGYSGGNCTWYAFGRAWELLGKLPNLCTNNAGAWYNYNKNNGYYPYGSTPKLGAIACWDHYDNDTGHVAVVEEIGSDYIVCSESGWSYTNGYFSTKTRSLNDSTLGMGSSYRFLGYIYIIDVDPNPPSNGWIRADKSIIEVGDSVTFEYGIDNAARKYLSMNKNGNYLGASESNNDSRRTVTFSEVGIYDVFVEAFNSVGAYGGNSPVRVTVLNKATSRPVNGWITADKSYIEVGDSVTFKYGIDYATTKYLSMNKNGNYWGANESNNKSEMTFTFSEVGEYDVFVEAFNSVGYGGSSPVKVMVLNKATKAPQNGWIRADKTSIPVGGQVTFEYGIDYATTKYLSMNKNGDYWGANESNKDSKKTLTFSQAGIYDVFVEAFNSQGYGGSSSVRVTVYEPTTTTTTSTTATRTGNLIEVQTNISNLSQSASCVAAVYDSSGKLIGQTANDINSSTNSVTAYFPNYSNASYVKVFLWDSLKGMKPLTSSEKVTL